MGAPPDPAWYDVLRDLGSFIGGVFALIAGGVAYLAGKIQADATKNVAAEQRALSTKRDQLQARCLALGIYPELLEIRAKQENAYAIVTENLTNTSRALEGIVADIKDAKIAIPPIINSSISSLYLLDRAGPSLIQLLSTILQYNRMLEDLLERKGTQGFFASLKRGDLTNHLLAMGVLVKEVERDIGSIHDGV